MNPWTVPTETRHLVGVLLYDDAWRELDAALALYTRKGKVGRYLYCTEVQWDDYFLHIAIEPVDMSGTNVRQGAGSGVGAGASEPTATVRVMRLSIPKAMVKFLAFSPPEAVEAPPPFPFGFVDA